MEGGLTLFVHAPWSCWGSVASVIGGSAEVGGAKMTAVAEMIAELAAAGPTVTPAGSRAAAGLAFCGAPRRTGANAREADHPLDWLRLLNLVFRL
jgi:hypothetical protein